MIRKEAPHEGLDRLYLPGFQVEDRLVHDDELVPGERDLDVPHHADVDSPPRQERFVSALRDGVGVPLLAVGAAFDYLAGTLTLPPRVVSENGFEWLWRLLAEPRRLWRRYLLLNPLFTLLVALEALGITVVRGERVPTDPRIDA